MEVLQSLKFFRTEVGINIFSVLRYKNTQKDIKIIGKELGVENILLGSIRKVGTKVK